MPRPPSPDGHRNHENVMLSDAERDLIDSVRGDLKRGPWIRQAALQVARGELVPKNSGIQESPAGDARESACPHPAARVHKGLCGACGTYVGSKK